MADRTCQKCGRVFAKPFLLKRHRQRKTPCDPILDQPDDASQDYCCKYCGRSFRSATAMHRHMRERCKIANSEEGMEKLIDHTLQRQLKEQKETMDKLQSQVAKLTELLQVSGVDTIVAAATPLALQHAEGGSTIVNGPVTMQQIHIENMEIRPWDSTRAITVDIAEIAAAFAENARLQEYARLPDHSLTDPDIAPPYVTELFTDLVRRGHTDPASRNIYLNPRRADQVLVHLKGGTWQVRTVQEGYRALLDGVATSVHEVTLAYEKRKLLPMEAQNALAMAGLLYDDEPEEYVRRAKASLAAHLTNLAPPSALTKQ